MHREDSDRFGLCRDHLQAVSSQEVEHADLPVDAAGQHAEEDKSQRSDLPAAKPAAGFATGRQSVLETAPPGQLPEKVRRNPPSNGF